MRAIANVVAMAFIACVAPSVAQAQSSAEPSADELVRRGVQARAAGRDIEALALFEQAWRASQSPVALAQIAAAEQALGRWIAAEAHMREALSHGEHPYIQRHRAILEASYGVISRRVGQLFVSANVQGAQVFIDGEQVATTPHLEPIRVLVGSHRLEVRAQGHYTVSRPIDVTPESPVREEATLRAPVLVDEVRTAVPPVTPVTRPITVTRVERGPRVATWVLWGAGAGVIAVGLTGNILRELAATRYNEQCVGPLDQRSACVSTRVEGDFELGLAVGGYVIGAGLVIAGAVDAVLPRTVRVTTVAIDPRRGSVSVGGSF